MRVLFSCLTAAALLGSAAPASAGWDNVFQVCCNDCRPRAITSYYAPAPVAAACPPQAQARVEYRQRSYYEPITVMKPERTVEAIPEQRKSYYYEPVTSYTYSSYYDPCSCSCQQIAVPRTSYRLREQCNTVMRYVERIRMVPTQSQRLVTETQPVVTYYYPPQSDACPPTAGLAPAAGPAVDELRTPPSVVPSGPGGGTGDNLPRMDLPTNPNTSRPRPGVVPPAPRLRPDLTTSRSAVVTVRGEVVENDQMTPRSAARVVFVSANNPERREYATANGYGEFDLRLPAGNWYVYLGGADGRVTYHRQVTLGDRASVDYRVVSR